MGFKKYLLVCSLTFGICSHITQAGQVLITNENKKELDIKIITEGDGHAVLKQKISADHQSSFNVTRTQLNGKPSFSIKGDTSPFTPSGKCDHLRVDKDYRVTFTNDAMGTTCLAEEVSAGS